MVNYNPDWDNCIIQREHWIGGSEIFALPVLGYLMAVNLTNITNMPNSREADFRARFAVRNHDDDQTIAKINWIYYYQQCGIMFSRPLPNLNAATPYLIRRYAPLKDCPELIVTTVHLGIKE